METIGIAFTTENFNTPEKLVNVSSPEQIKKIYEVAEALKPFQKDLFSFNMDMVLFDIPEDCDFRYDIGYLRCYIDVFGDGKISVYQYFQNKWDSAIQIESESIDLEELLKQIA